MLTWLFKYKPKYTDVHSEGSILKDCNAGKLGNKQCIENKKKENLEQTNKEGKLAVHFKIPRDAEAEQLTQLWDIFVPTAVHLLL